jgi:hypothetical protein
VTNKFENNKKEKTVAQKNEITQIDQDGVVIQTHTENIFKLYTASEPHYIKHYQQCFESINALKNRTEEILQEILLYTTYNKNTIYLNQQIKVDICNKLGLAYQTMTNALTELKQSQILLYVDTGLYIVNPYYFGKGEWKELRKIREKIKITVYSKDINGRKIEQYKFDYSELSDQFFDKDKLKKAKPKKTKSETASPTNSEIINDIKPEPVTPISSEVANAVKVLPWYRKLPILSWCLRY